MPNLVAKVDQLTVIQKNSPLRALVLDDSEDCLALTRMILEEGGFEVKCIEDPMELIDAAFEFRPEIFLLDYHLPNADGVELAKMLRQEESFISTPIFFLTGNTNEMTTRRMMLEGANKVFSKPVDPTDLVESTQVSALSYRNQSIHNEYFGMLDPITGLHNEHYFTGELDSVCRDKSKRERKYLIAIEITNINSFCEALVQSLNGGDYSAQDESILLTACAAAIPIQNTGSESLRIVDALCRQTALVKSQGYHVKIKREKKHDEKETNYWLKQLGIAIEHHNIFLNYQPIISLANDESNRFEVLVRLKDEENRTISPSKFYHSATLHGIDKYIDRWVITNSIKYLKTAKDKNQVLFIKIPKNSIDSEGFGPWLDKILIKSELPANKLIFEFSENDVKYSMVAMKHLIRKIDCHGFQCALEHFGKHEKSADILDMLPVSYVKFDKSVTHNIFQRAARQKELEKMLKSKPLISVEKMASYIESPESLVYIASKGFSLVQGNLLQEPMQTPNYDELVMDAMKLPYNY